VEGTRFLTKWLQAFSEFNMLFVYPCQLILMDLGICLKHRSWHSTRGVGGGRCL